MVKNLPAILETQEMQVRSLSREDPLEKEMSTHSSILAWEAHGQRSLMGFNGKGCEESDRAEGVSTALFLRFGSLLE